MPVNLNIPSKYSIQLLRSQSGLDEMRDNWQILQEECGEYPFTDPALVEAWWQNKGEPEGHRLQIVALLRNQRLVGVAPLAVTKIHGLRFLRWAGGDLFGYCNTLSADEEANARLWQAVHRVGGYDVALLKAISRETSAHIILGRSARLVRTNIARTISFGQRETSLWKERSDRPKFRRKLRQLEAKGALRFMVAPDGQIPEGVIEVLVAQKNEWTTFNSKTGLFEKTGSLKPLICAFAEGLDEIGALHLSWLACGDEIIAVHLGCVYRKRLYHYLTSYNVAWSKFSPGEVLLISLIGWAEENQIQHLDFMRGDYAWKTELSNGYGPLDDFTCPGSLIGRIATPLLNKFYFSAGERRLNTA